MQVSLKKENVVFSKWFQKSFWKINFMDKNFILEKIWKIFSWEILPDIKKLKNYPNADFRLKIWNYRILFSYDKKNDKNLFILVTHRKNLY